MINKNFSIFIVKPYNITIICIYIDNILLDCGSKGTSLHNYIIMNICNIIQNIVYNNAKNRLVYINIYYVTNSVCNIIQTVEHCIKRYNSIYEIINQNATKMYN